MTGEGGRRRQTKRCLSIGAALHPGLPRTNDKYKQQVVEAVTPRSPGIRPAPTYRYRSCEYSGAVGTISRAGDDDDDVI